MPDAGDELHRDRRVADRRADGGEDSRCDRRAARRDGVALEQLVQHRQRRARPSEQLVVVEGSEIGTGRAEGDRLVAFTVDLRPLRRRHHPAEMLDDAGHQIRALVVGVGDVRRHIGVIAEEGQVELLDGDRRTAHAEHAHVGQVDVHVPAEEPDRLRVDRVELVGGVRTDAHVAVSPAEADAPLPRELLAERAGRRRQHLTRVGPGVVREAGARRPVGDPAVVHHAMRARSARLLSLPIVLRPRSSTISTRRGHL